jgi:hypothetical protein
VPESRKVVLACVHDRELARGSDAIEQFLVDVRAMRCADQGFGLRPLDLGEDMKCVSRVQATIAFDEQSQLNKKSFSSDERARVVFTAGQYMEVRTPDVIAGVPGGVDDSCYLDGGTNVVPGWFRAHQRWMDLT